MIKRLFLFLLVSLLLFSCDNGSSDHSQTGDAVISYDANGADYGSIPSSHGTELAVQGNIGNLEKNGYVFDGWNSSSDGSGSDYIPGSTCPLKSTKLYAKWALIFNYNVSNSMRSSDSQKALSLAPSSGAYLHITGLTQKGKQLSDLAITDTIDGYSVTSIKSGAFRGCSNMKKITIAGSVRSIGDGAFAGCGSLETLVLKGTEPPEMGSGVLEFCPAAICVPPEAKESYSQKAGWSSYASQLVSYFTVTFKSGNATIDAYPPEKQVIYPETTVDSLPADPVRSGYSFGGWYTGQNGTGTMFTANTEVNSDLTVYAKWILISQGTGTRLSFSIISFTDARVPSHLYHNITPDSSASYYYKAVPRWTADKNVVGATKDYVQLPYKYSIKTHTIDMGLFAPGAWDFDVRVVSSKGVVLYEKKLSNVVVDSQPDNIEFILEKRYEGSGTLQINAIADTVESTGGMVIYYAGPQTGTITIPESESMAGADGTSIFRKTLSLSPGFYVVTLTLNDGGENRAYRSGYIEVFGNETSVLDGTVYRDTWMAEGYTDVGVSGGFFFAGKKKLGMVVSTNGNIHSRTWTFNACQTEDSEEIGIYVWYVNGVKQDPSDSTFVLRNLKPGNYKVHCFAVDSSISYLVGAEISIPVR